MAKPSFYIEGFDKMHKELRRTIAQKLMDRMGKSVDYIVRHLANYAKKHGDYIDQTGNLRSSIHGVLVKVTSDLIVGEVRAPMEYAAAVEARNYRVVSFVLTEQWAWISRRLKKDFEKVIKEINSGKL